jgi:chromosome segregation ATPase
LHSLRSTIRRCNAKITALEEQLSTLEQSKAHYENEFRTAQSRGAQLTEANEKLELDLTKLRTALKKCEQKHAKDCASFENSRQSFEETRERMQKELTALGQELSATQHKLSLTSHDLEKLRSDFTSQESELREIEAQNSKYRELAHESRKTETQDSAVLAQLELLESERNRLKDGLVNCQQQISRLEAAKREHAEQWHRELGDAKQQQMELETELSRAQVDKEALAHEITLLKGELATSHEALESRFRAQIAAERNNHRAEIARLKAQFSNGVKGNSAEERLLSALAAIDALKSEKAALLVRLQSHRAGGDMGLLMNVSVRERSERGKYVPLAAIVPGKLHGAVEGGETIVRNALGRLERRPVLRTVVFLWVVLLHFLYLKRILA